MSDITSSDLKIILRAAVQMAQQDSALKPMEIDLLREIIAKAGLEPDAAGSFEAPLKEDILVLAEGLTTDRAKKVFLLGMAVTAISDGALHPKEKELFDKLVRLLGVGTINLDRLTFEEGKKTLLEQLAEAGAEVQEQEGGRYSDLDML